MRILHLFHHNIREIIDILPLIREQGFDSLQIAPIQPTKSNSRELSEWWLGYQPLGLRIGNAQVGSKEDLIKLCNKAHEIGLKVIQDVIVRHVATDNVKVELPHKLVDKELLPYIIDRPLMTDDSIREQCTDYNCGMPMLDYDNKEYQQLVIRFFDELMSCGVDMLRIDQGAKHFRLPSENGTMVSEVFSKYPCYGEGIFIDKYYLDQYSEYMMIGSETNISDKNKLITWIDSHDLTLHFKVTEKLTGNMLINEYRLICENYPHTLFYAKPFDNTWQSEGIRYANSIR